MNRPRIIDGDGHIQEDIAAISRRLPAEYRRMAETSGGALGIFPPLDHLHTAFRDTPATLQGRGRVGPEEWIAFLDDVGIEATVLFPTAGLSYGRIPYPEVGVAVTRAYNDWLHETYTSRSRRFKGMALIPMQDPEAAAQELRRVVTQYGFCGAMLPSNGLRGHLGSKEYWGVYQAASDLGCCLAVHGGSHIDFGMDQMDVWPFIHALGHPIGQMIALAGMVSNGVFDRYPNVRIGFMEAGVAWLLACLERFDSSWASFSQHDASGRFLRLRPGE
ncbi:MAG: amidohydrolase family protein, partial [Chloroflexota bacterium]